MFNRGNAQSPHDIKMTAVRLELTDGSSELVNITTGAHQTIGAAFNNPDMFVEIEDGAGVSRLLAKTAIVSAQPVAAPRTDQLQRHLKQVVGFDPYQTLGVERGADMATIQKAYRERAAQYHPDRFASLDLPKEMATYIDSMARRINMAWQELSKSANAA